MTLNRLAIVVAFLAGVFMLVQYFVVSDLMNSLYRTLLDYYQIIFAMTMVVGGMTLLRHHLLKLTRFDRNSIYSGATVIAILFMVVSAMIFGTGTQSPYHWAFHNIQAPMQATTFSLLAFFVASAAYRGFRVRTKPAAVLAVVALLLLLGRSTFGEMISEQIPQLAGWVLNNPSVAAKRGILVGIGLGSVATALRVILGVERSYL